MPVLYEYSPIPGNPNFIHRTGFSASVMRLQPLSIGQCLVERAKGTGSWFSLVRYYYAGSISGILQGCSGLSGMA